MKLLFFDDFKLGVLKGDTVVDVSQVVRDIPHIGPHTHFFKSDLPYQQQHAQEEGGLPPGTSTSLREPSLRHHWQSRCSWVDVQPSSCGLPAQTRPCRPPSTSAHDWRPILWRRVIGTAPAAPSAAE